LHLENGVEVPRIGVIANGYRNLDWPSAGARAAGPVSEVGHQAQHMIDRDQIIEDWYRRTAEM
jgi:hypothetical protein